MKTVKFKIIALVMAFMMLTSSPARAVEPLTTFLIVSAVAHVIVGGVLWYQGTMKNSSKGASVTPSSTIGRGATVQWIDTKDIDTRGLPKAKQKDVTVKVNGQKLLDAVKKNPSKYPVLYPLTLSDSLSVGDVIDTPYGRKKVTGYSEYSANGSQYIYLPNESASGYTSSEKFNYVPRTDITPNPNNGYLYYSKRQSWLLASTSDPLSSGAPVDASKFSQKLAGSVNPLTAPTAVFSDRIADIDEYIKSNPGAVTVLDSSDPSNVDTASPARLPAPATQSAVNTAVAAASARAAAQKSVEIAQGNYNADPSAENSQRLANSQRELSRLISEQVGSGIVDNPEASHDGDGEGDEEGQDTGGFDETAYGDKTDSDLDLGTRFKAFFDQMKTTAVFSLPNQFLNGLPTGGSSTMSFNGGRFGQHTFDFAALYPLWNALKGLFLVIFGWYSVKIVALKGGGG